MLCSQLVAPLYPSQSIVVNPHTNSHCLPIYKTISRKHANRHYAYLRGNSSVLLARGRGGGVIML